jgi:hypothetical protein
VKILVVQASKKKKQKGQYYASIKRKNVKIGPKETEMLTSY